MYKMDIPYTYSQGSNHLNSVHGECQYYSSDCLVLDTPKPYEETEISGDSCKTCKLDWAEPPVEIHEECTTDIDLPLLVWQGYDIAPKILSVWNTGRTIEVNGQWSSCRPYIEGGPLNGKYVFSQIHFHCPSEHEIDGRRYPLEMHVVHYKASYLTQERAMHEKDGTLVLVYLFQAVESEETILSRITRVGSYLERVNARVEIGQVRLSELVKPFFCNYYVYWGSVVMNKNAYVLQWIINCNQSQVTKEEVNGLMSVMSTCVEPNVKGPKMKPLNSTIYRVGENYEVTTKCQTTTSTQFDLVSEAPHLSVHQVTSPCACSQQHSHSATHYAGCSGIITTTQPQSTNLLAQSQNVCSTCGGLEVEINLPKHLCKCKRKSSKVCSSCGGSKSSLSWCKRKWKHCKSKCSLLSKTSSCSNSDSSCKKSKKKTKSGSKRSRKKSSCSSNDEKHSDHECNSSKKSCVTIRVDKKPGEESRSSKKSGEESRSSKKSGEESRSSKKSGEESRSSKKSGEESRSSKKSGEESRSSKKSCSVKPPEEVCPVPVLEKSSSKIVCEIPRSEKECERPIDQESRKSSREASCRSSSKEPSPKRSTSSCSTPCSSTSGVSVKKKKKKKGKNVCKKTSVTSVKRKETKVKKVKKKDDDEKSKTVTTKNESETCTLKEDDKSPKSRKKSKSKKERKVKSKETLDSSDKSSGREGSKKKRSKSKKTKGKEDCTEVTTLFVNIPENLFPADNISNFSCSDVGLSKKKNSDNSELKCAAKEQEFVVNNLTTKVSKSPNFEKRLSGKRLGFEIKHCFQGEKSDFTNLPQEYLVSIIYDNNVLQEYRGLFQPQGITPGISEKLELVPKYEEPDDLGVRLEECVIEKPSADKFCIDSKFLLKNWDADNFLSCTTEVPVEDSKQKIVNVSNAETQCSVEKVDVKDSPSVKCQFVQTEEEHHLPITDKIKRFFWKNTDMISKAMQTEPQNDDRRNLNTDELPRCKTRILKTVSEPEFSTEVNKIRQDKYINLLEAKLCKPENLNLDKSSPKLECKIKLVKNPLNSTEETEPSSSSQVMEEKDIESDFKDARRNTVYFIYDKIEKDPLTGKKIFMGRFRTKDDLRILKEHKITSKTDSLKSFGGSGLSEKSSSVQSHASKKGESSDVSGKRSANAKRQQPPREIKDEVSVQKFEPDCLNVTQFKSPNPNVMVTDLVTQFKPANPNVMAPDLVKWFQEDGENFDVLSDVMEAAKKAKSKTFEQTTMTESVSGSNSAEGKPQDENSASKNTICEDKATMYSVHSLTSKDTQNLEDSIGLKSPDSNAVVVVPVEVESWSKIEVVLIDRSGDKEAIKESKKYIPFS